MKSTPDSLAGLGCSDWLSTWCAWRGKTRNPIVVAVMRQSSIRVGLGALEHPARIFRTEAPSKPCNATRTHVSTPTIPPSAEGCVCVISASTVCVGGSGKPLPPPRPLPAGRRWPRFGTDRARKVADLKGVSALRWHNRSGRFQFVRRTTTLATPISSTSSSQSQSWALRSTWPLAF